VKFTRESSASLAVRSVSAAGIRVGDATYRRTIAITPDTVLDDWPDKPVADLDAEDFAALLETNPEIILLGTGAANRFPPRELTFAMARRRIGLEVMATPAAARTFNVLAAEGRKVAAVLYP
jgi:uncharacterized protein